MTNSVLTLVPNGGSTGWDQMCLGYDGTPINWNVFNSNMSVQFSLTDAAAAGDISKITIAYKSSANNNYGCESYVYCLTKVSGTVYETSPRVHSVNTPTWYYMDITENPATEAAWEWDEIDALIAGMRVVVNYGGRFSMYQFKVQVYYDPGTYLDTSMAGAGIIGSGGSMFF